MSQGLLDFHSFCALHQFGKCQQSWCSQINVFHLQLTGEAAAKAPQGIELLQKYVGKVKQKEGCCQERGAALAFPQFSAMKLQHLYPTELLSVRQIPLY